MSQSKKLRFGIFFLVAILSCFVVGCKKSTSVNDIFFNLNEGEQIVLIVGESLEMDDYISFKPSSASNKSYSLKSFDEDIVRIEKNQIVAVAAGNAQVKVVSNDNKLKEDLVTVVVKNTKTVLDTPRNIKFSVDNQLLSFDKVAFATSYTLKVNNEEFDLGNSNVFSMSKYKGDAYNNLLHIQIKAISPTYTKALEDSEFSEDYIYQAGGVENIEIRNGVLTFHKEFDALKVNVYLGERLVAEESSSKSFSLKELNESYTGVSTQLYVETVVTEEIKSNYAGDITFFNSAKQSADLHVLDVPIVSVNQTTLTWQNIAYAQGYAIVVDGEEIEYTQNNYFDLASLDDFAELFSVDDVHTVLIDPILNDLSLNVGKTSKTNPIKVKRLAETTIKCDGHNIAWDSVDNALAYAFSLNGGGVEISSSTTLNSLSLLGYEAGEYQLKVQALGGFVDDNDVYHISSKAVEKTFVKYTPVTAQIEDYVLKVSDLGETVCYVEFDNSELNTTLSSQNSELNLANLDFEIGENTIRLTRKGTEDSVLSEIFTISFVQLANVTNLRIENGVVKFDNNEINANAKIKLETCDANEVKYTLEDTQANNHTYNTVDAQGENYLEAGEYTAKVYVLGDGSSVFSVRTGGEEVACATLDFEVLPAPVISLKSTSESILKIQEIENVTKYDIYSVETKMEESEEDTEEGVEPLTEGETITFVGETTTDEFEFELMSGSIKYYAQSKGDGSRYLDSTYGLTIEIVRLKTPILSYNSAEEVFTRTDLNEDGLTSGFEFSVDGVVEDYDFASAKHFENSVSVTIVALAFDKIDGVYYLNSQPTTLNLTKISNVATINMNAFNNVDIEPEHKVGKYELEVEFVLDGGNELFYPKEEGVLTNGTLDLNYSYLNGVYTIEVIQDYEAIFEEMNDGFGVRARFIYPEGNNAYINSEFSTVQDLEFTKITSETTFTVNENNQLVVAPADHAQKHGLILVINESEDLTFVSNGTSLVSNKGEMTFTYDEELGVYLVDLLDAGCNTCDDALKSNFTVKVRYTSHLDGTESYLDSGFSDSVTVNSLPETTISRDGQSLKIVHPRNDYTYNNYGLVINNKHLLILTEDAITQGDGCVLVDYQFVYNNAPESVLEEVNTVGVVVLNLASNETYLELSKKGNEILIQKTPTVSLSVTKDNSVDDNSAVIEFETYITTYDKDYYIVFYTEGGQEITSKRYVDTDAVDGVITFKLDSIEALEGSFYVEAYVRASSSYNSIEVFNSVKSNKIELNKVETVTGLKVSESILTFDAVENAIGYEIYERTGTGYLKLNQGLVSTNSFEFVNITSAKEIVVKAISASDGYTNATYSNPITIKPMSTFTVEVKNGEFYVTFPPQVLAVLLEGSATIVPEITNAQGDVVELDIEAEDSNIELIGFTQLKITPQVLLAYNTESLQPEDFLVKIKVRYDETEREEYYLNTPVVELVAYGLLAPTDVRKTTDENKTVEFITWTPSEMNTIDGETIDVGFDFKVEHTLGEDTKTYYSTDTKLRYFDGENFVSYNTILTDTSIKFPAGYDEDEDGKLDVEFKEGYFKISVRTMPNTSLADYNICYSVYSQAHEFEILGTSTIKVEEGAIAWDEQVKASKYKVEVFEDGETSAFITDYVTTNAYDFSNTSLNAYSGVLKVVVTAISTRDDILSGQSSEPIFVYRLPEATAVHVEDGQLVVSANKFFSSAEIEFVDTTTGKKYVEKYTNESALTNLSGLGIETWEGFENDAKINEKLMFSVKLDEEVLSILDGRTYTINVRLIGNTNDVWGTITTSKAINVSYLSATKMNANVTEISYGVIQFEPNVNYATITKGATISYQSLVDLNYKFNGATSTDFWHNTAIYKIRVEKSDGHAEIYAVDYFSFMSALESGLIETAEYEILDRTNGLYAVVKYNVSASETIYFNVYLENKLNLREYDEISYYQTTQIMIGGVNTWSSVATEKTIRLSDGGSFVVTITMLGGDSQADAEITVGQLNAGISKLKTFVRYGVNNLSSLNGKVEFVDLIPFEEGLELDNPVYKIVVTRFNTTDDKVFYLYHNSEEDAKTVASKHDAQNYLTATYLQVEKIEGSEGVLFFDLSQYISAGTYKVTIRTLAGLGSGESEDVHYLLNSKAPTTSYTFYKLSDVEFVANKGVLEFEQSLILRDSNIIYCDNYEVTLYDGENNPYVYTIDRTSENVEFDDVEHIVRYTVPSHLNFEEMVLPIDAGVEYKIKIKAISQENFILNGTYAQTNQIDNLFTFKKSQGVSDLRIDEGILKWKVDDLENHTNTVIKVNYLDGNNEVKIIYITVNDVNKVVEEEYLYHYYQFTDGKYNGEFITNNVDYTISAYTVGSGNVLNSNYCQEITTSRLKTVDAETVETLDGVLVWEEIEDAQYYEININGETYTSLENTLDVSEFDLKAGYYSVNVRAIGTDRINASWLTSHVEGFAQLGFVEINSIQVGGNKVSWGAVENAQGYGVVFNYTDLEGNSQTVETAVETNEFTMETTGMLGRFTISITAIGIGEGKVFNGKTVEFTSSSDAPAQVKNFEFDNTKNRFVVEVDNLDFLASDSLEIIYNFEEYTSQTDKAVARRVTNTIAYQTGSYEFVDENTTKYYLPITVMGVYSNIYVQVVRPNTLSSVKTQLDDIDYQLFSYGAGTFGDDETEANPYRIYNAEQLLNISYFPSANYVLTSSINLTGFDIVNRLANHNAVIAKEFNGCLDGANFSIIGFNINEETGKDIIAVENATNFALFETLNNATIKNLVIGKEDIQLILTNTFALTSSSVIKLSLIATGANNSTLDNIIVPDYTIELKQDSSLTKRNGAVYIGGLVAEMSTTTIINTSIDLLVNLDANIANDVDIYIGGVSAKATLSNVNNSTLAFDVQTKSGNLLTYVGGTFAHFVGNTARMHGVRETSVEFNMVNVQALYVGGIAGFARYMLIDTSETTGTYTKSYISNNTYVGGLVGHAQSAIIQNSGSYMNLNLTVSNTTNKFIGAIVGRMSIQSGISAEILNCYSHYYVEGQEETVVSTSQLTIGMFGSATGASVQGNYKKEQ